MKMNTPSRHRKGRLPFVPALLLTLLALCGAASAQTTTSDTSADTIQPYPTFSEAVFFAARDLPLGERRRE